MCLLQTIRRKKVADTMGETCSAQHPKFHSEGHENPVSLAIIPHTLPDESSTANEEESSKSVFERLSALLGLALQKGLSSK